MAGFGPDPPQWLPRDRAPATSVLTCHTTRQQYGAGAGTCTGLRCDPLTQEHIGEKVEAIARDVSQQHGTSTPVQTSQALSPHNGNDALYWPLVHRLLAKRHCSGFQTNAGCEDRRENIASDPGGQKPDHFLACSLPNPLTVPTHGHQFSPKLLTFSAAHTRMLKSHEEVPANLHSHIGDNPRQVKGKSCFRIPRASGSTIATSF